MAEYADLEIIVGTYEEILLAYRVTVVGEEWQMEESFTDHSHLGSIRNVAVSKRRGFLASGGTDETVWLYSLKSRRLIGSLTQHTGSVTYLQFHQGSHLFSCSEDGTLCLWKTFTWECLRTFKGHKGGINCVAVHPSGKLALSVSKDKTLRAWNLLKGRRAYVTNLYRVADLVIWSPNGDNYIVVFGNKIEVYLTENAALTRIIEATGRVNAILFVTDSLIAFAGESSEIEFYDIVKDASQHKITFSSTRTRGLCFKKLPSGKEILISACSDGFIRIWNVSLTTDGITTKCLLQHNSTFRLTCLDAFVNVPKQPSATRKLKTNKEVKQSEEETLSPLPVKSAEHLSKRARHEEGVEMTKKKKKKKKI